MTQTYTFFVHGMHCKACVGLTESELGELPNISAAQSNLQTRTVVVTGEFGAASRADVAVELTKVLRKHGYTLSTEPEKTTVAWKEFGWAVPSALGFVLLFVVLQKMGIVNLVNTSSVTYGTAFAVGIVASLSTCMAVVGGLVLSMSATFAKEGDRVRPQVLFHAGRIVSFFVLGGVIGAVGSVFQFGANGMLIIGLLVGAVMLVLGINLLDIFDVTKRILPAMPAAFSKKTLTFSKLNHSLTPALVGMATFFLPCGFTQSMQLYTLSTGSFWHGGLTMLSFALGTLPVLALVSFSSLSMKNSPRAGVFFKSAGLVVILFAIFNIINSLVAAGIIGPVFNF